MRERARPAVFIDFDNTITKGDVLDEVIERFSPTQEWREWEAEWKAGNMSTPECLRRQVGGLRASMAELMAAVSDVEVDPAFVPLLRWAKGEGIEVQVLSDNFAPLIAQILRRQHAPEVPVFANELAPTASGVEARFPFRDPACARCAHCKARHLKEAAGRERVYVGDGLSDVCPALVADTVFAKDSLAAELSRRGVAFRPFATLEDVWAYLRGRIARPLVA